VLRVYLLRHGETTYNADGNKYCGRTDADLTSKGIQQAKRVAGLLEGIVFQAVYSSPLKRAFTTARIASGNLDVITDERLTEMDFGNWEGKTRAAFMEENPELWNQWSQDPGATRAGGTGETAAALLNRVEGFFSEMRQHHPSGDVLVVAHNAVNRFFLASQLEMPLKNYRRIVQNNSSVTLIHFDDVEGFSLASVRNRF